MPVTEAHLSDMRHRIANDILLIVAVLQRQRDRRCELTADEAIDDAQGSLLTLAQLYRGLYERGSDDVIELGSFLARVGQSLRASYLDGLGIALFLDIESITVPRDLARDLGLVVAELIAATARFAFTERSGTIRVRLKTDERGLVCGVFDDGDGCSSDRIANMSGSLAGAMCLAADVRGWLEHTPDVARGHVFELVVPLAQHHRSVSIA